nr:immunoglobulin light chain junction region [Macaca mulatta]MPN85180.1 immunoglobulin light chain junction region [Macaca mulatta]MPN85183.1 immunoglobulin light chain junction region [Macaca mulatta]MPN85192.1 immunoglobulin light chain junction region [Macaca mulatta]MPN85203.1 immunoglobulin light chain junction region [Macaca mulatta]
CAAWDDSLSSYFF